MRCIYQSRSRNSLQHRYHFNAGLARHRKIHQNEHPFNFRRKLAVATPQRPGKPRTCGKNASPRKTLRKTPIIKQKKKNGGISAVFLFQINLNFLASRVTAFLLRFFKIFLLHNSIYGTMLFKNKVFLKRRSPL